MESNQKKIADIIAANRIPELEFGTTIDESGTNVRLGHFHAYFNGVTHPCYLDERELHGYRIDMSIAYSPTEKGWREYVPGQPITAGKWIYLNEGL